MIAEGRFMKKIASLLAASAIFCAAFVSCGGNEEDYSVIAAGEPCQFENAETCSDDGLAVLLCDSTKFWQTKIQCNPNFGEMCQRNSDSSLSCRPAAAQPDEGNVPDQDETPAGLDEDMVPAPDETPAGPDEDRNPAPDEMPAQADEDTIPEPDETPAQTDEDTIPEPDETPAEADEDTVQEPDETPDEHDSDTIGTPDEDADQGCLSNDECTDPALPLCSIATSTCVKNAVFFSEYVSGSNSNKAFEIYNGSKSTINLNNYVLKVAKYNYLGRDDWGKNENNVEVDGRKYTFSETTTLASGDVYVVCHKSVGTALASRCDDIQTSVTAILNFTGMDAYAIFFNGEIIDQIGSREQAGSSWSFGVADINYGALTAHTLRRKESVVVGTTDWISAAGTNVEDSEWVVYPEDAFDGLGTR